MADEQRGRVTQNISLQPEEQRHAKAQADRFHGGNISRYFQTLIARDEASGGRLGMPAALLDVTETAA